MIALLDNGQDLDQCEAEIGVTVGQLLTPLTRYRLRNSELFGIDNGGFSGLDIPAFLALLKREEHHKDKCLFVAAPDVVGSARRTLEVFERWKARLDGWKIAVVCQDGQEDLPMPWDDISAIFIGGSTVWKCSHHVEHLIRAAKALDKWVHVGRVNNPIRWSHFEKLGADSCDGTGIARYTHMREAIANRANQGDFLSA
jgi:hypothetical protein